MFSQHHTFIVGYYGMKNTGDDALLAASAWGAETYLHAKNIIATNCEPVTVNKKYNLTATVKDKATFKGQNRLLRYKHALGAEHVIFGGGSVFHNTQDITIKRHLMALAKGKKHIAVGVSLGPFKNTSAERACQKFLNECYFTGLRDKNSFQLAQDLAPNANTALTFDLAPLLLCQQPNITPSNNGSIGVSLCPKDSLTGNPEKDKKRAHIIAKILHELYQTTGKGVTFITINGHPEFGDKAVHNWVKTALPDCVPFNEVNYDPNPFNVMSTLAGLSVILSMRLHGSILSYLVDTPVVSLNYHEKCEGWCDQVGLPAPLRVDLSHMDCDAICQSIINGLENGFEKNALLINDAVMLAKKNWEFDQ